MAESSVVESVQLGNVQLVVVQSLFILTGQYAVRMNITNMTAAKSSFLIDPNGWVILAGL